ncbi:uncharacterized protein isoform X2 [Rhodnius prolixus]|uniref:uncharacterized protein isoform X2 n=1 Tax=Rhodnius prolixus TaxID=13249 RepID=UPI003D189AC5
MVIFRLPSDQVHSAHIVGSVSRHYATTSDGYWGQVHCRPPDSELLEAPRKRKSKDQELVDTNTWSSHWNPVFANHSTYPENPNESGEQDGSNLRWLKMRHLILPNLFGCCQGTWCLVKLVESNTTCKLQLLQLKVIILCPIGEIANYAEPITIPESILIKFYKHWKYLEEIKSGRVNI